MKTNNCRIQDTGLFSALGTLSLLIALLFAMGCETAYYGTMEKLGVHKRDIMVDRVENARDAQTEAKEQFSSALEQFSSVLKFSGGNLEEKYKTLQGVYDKSEAKANEVHDRIAKVESVSQALFTEWEEELDQYSSAALRADSKKKLVATKRQYAKLIAAMQRAAKKIDPVLTALHDQVLYLKHNLNVQAIASLQNELLAVQNDVAALIKEMELSIKEANQFIDTMLQ